MDDLQKALISPEGATAAKDPATFASGGAAVLIFEERDASNGELARRPGRGGPAVTVHGRGAGRQKRAGHVAGSVAGWVPPLG